MKLNRFHWALVLVSIILGVMLAMQFRVTRDIRQNDAIMKMQDLSNQVAQMKKERDVLQAQVARMRGQLDKLSTGPLAPQMKEDLARVEVLAGFTELTGPGLEVTLKDSEVSLKPGDNPNQYVVHDEDILKVVNELKAAGAEAIAVNGQRFISSTEISCSGPIIRINKKPLAPPFVITAIGDPETMEGALKMKGGVAENLQYFGIQISLKKTQVTVPAYTGGVKYNYAVESD